MSEGLKVVKPHPCVKCGAEMEFGLLIDSTNRGEKLFEVIKPEQVLEWVRGSPAKSIWTLEFKADGENRLQVATVRCTACGFLELYAR